MNPKLKTALRLISHSILVIKNFAICVVILTLGALYPFIMDKFGVEYVDALSFPSYAFEALFMIYFAKTINSLIFLSTSGNLDLFERIKQEIN